MDPFTLQSSTIAPTFSRDSGNVQLPRIVNSQTTQGENDQIHSHDIDTYDGGDSDDQDGQELRDGYADSPNLPVLPIEILERIFSHLSQSMLQYSVNRVCKTWCQASNRFIRRVGIWKPDISAQELLLQHWSKIDTLQLWFNVNPGPRKRLMDAATQNAFWKAFATTITEPILANNRDGARHDNNSIGLDLTASPSLIHTIRHLEARGSWVNYIDIMSNLRGHLQFVESFTITTSRSHESTPLFTILADFPALKSLSIKLETWLITYLTHGDGEDRIDGPGADSPKTFPERYRLQRFCIDGVITSLGLLERLIATCPDLRVFNAKRVNINVTSQQQEASDAVIRDNCNARLRLSDMAAKHCPKLEQYNLHQIGHALTDENSLESIARSFPNLTMHSITLYNYPTGVPKSFVVRNLLSKMTFLEIQTCNCATQSTTLNWILCRTPNLSHLLGSGAYLHTVSLWQPPAFKLVYAITEDQKQYKRIKRLKAQKVAIDHCQSGGTYSTPLTWQVYKLKTLELIIAPGNALADLTNYICRNGLFKNLVTFNVQSRVLRVGQRKYFTDDPKKKKKSASTTDSLPTTTATTTAPACAAASSSSATESAKQSPLATEAPIDHPRFTNELLDLRGLRCLEECILRPAFVPGMTVAKDFEFLQLRDDFQVTPFLSSSRTKNSKQMVATAAVVGTILEDDEGDVDGTDDNVVESKVDEDRWMTETFWPKLNTFHIIYHKIPPLVDTVKLISGFEQIRPGVSFRFQARSLP
ncbi:MAG: hypothetical protein JOS17DRAFT_734433 [Linnemannia elongata]|nr:MAG: hypothetical protein JOS17DRAFT_734433 [Linnemannia elongata]